MRRKHVFMDHEFLNPIHQISDFSEAMDDAGSYFSGPRQRGMSQPELVGGFNPSEKY